MREKYYGLLKEYLLSLREHDLQEQAIQVLPEGFEKDEAAKKLELVRKRCNALRREVRQFPG